jgi:simple sugar transport system substrate-binding protein
VNGLYRFIILAALLLVAATACQGGQLTSLPTPTTGAAAGGQTTVGSIAVLLPASQTDQGWNQQAADAMTEVAAARNIELEIAENLGYEDITPVLRDVAERGFDLLICHAAGYQTVCPEFAMETGARVAVVENPGAVEPGLVADVETQAQEVAYLAGVLAAGMTQTGTVGVIVSGEPPTWNFMTVGFAEGVHAARPETNFLYNVIGEAAYEDAAGAKRATEAQLAAGADIIFGMGDGASFGMLQAIAEHNNSQPEQLAWFIDVIGDKSQDYRELLLTSVLFDYTGVYNQMIDEIEQGTFGRVYTMDVQSGGVRLLDLPEAVPAETAQAVEQAREDIISGKIKVSAVVEADQVHTRLDELFPQ